MVELRWLSNCYYRNMQKLEFSTQVGAPSVDTHAESSQLLENSADVVRVCEGALRLHSRFNALLVGFGILETAKHAAESTRSAQNVAENVSLQSFKEGE